jgi:SNF2 family DNA or RNA helicase
VRGQEDQPRPFVRSDDGGAQLHQITAVYESLLPRQPLRFVLADDPGAGKTIMAGLYIRELIMRADSHRILIVAPGSLVEQWRDELFEKFGLEFHVYSSLPRSRETPAHRILDPDDSFGARYVRPSAAVNASCISPSLRPSLGSGMVSST